MGCCGACPIRHLRENEPRCRPKIPQPRRKIPRNRPLLPELHRKNPGNRPLHPGIRRTNLRNRHSADGNRGKIPALRPVISRNRQMNPGNRPKKPGNFPANPRNFAKFPALNHRRVRTYHLIIKHLHRIWAIFDQPEPPPESAKSAFRAGGRPGITTAVQSKPKWQPLWPTSSLPPMTPKSSDLPTSATPIPPTTTTLR